MTSEIQLKKKGKQKMFDDDKLLMVSVSPTINFLMSRKKNTINFLSGIFPIPSSKHHLWQKYKLKLNANFYFFK